MVCECVSLETPEKTIVNNNKTDKEATTAYVPNVAGCKAAWWVLGRAGGPPQSVHRSIHPSAVRVPGDILAADMFSEAPLLSPHEPSV